MLRHFREVTLLNVLIGSAGDYHEYFYPVIISSFLATLRMYKSYKGMRLCVTEVLSCVILEIALVALLGYYDFSAGICLFSGAVTGLLGTKRIIRLAEIIILRRCR